MICKYYLMIGSDKVDINSQSCIDVSSMIANLKDIKLSYNRIDYGGVTRKCGSNIEFVGNARDVLIEHFTINGLNSIASFAVYGIENDWTYKEIFSCPLDFSTFTYDSYKAEIGCIDNSIAALIKANKTTKYEYPVAEIKESVKLAYDRVSIRNEVTVQAIGSKVMSEDTYTSVDKNVWWFYPRIGVINSDTPNNESINYKDSEEIFQTDGTPMIWGMPGLNKTNSYFLECLKDCVVSVDFTDIGLGDYLCGLVLAKISGSSITPLSCGYSNVMSKDKNTYQSALKWSGELKAGEKLQFAIYNYNHGSMGSNIAFQAHKDGYVSWNERQSPIYFDVIKPEVLLGRLISSICSGIDVKCMIKASSGGIDNVRLSQTMLCSAESIRQFSSAKVNTSFDDFCKWMETTFGYVYQIVEMAESDKEFILPNIYDFNGFAESSQLDTSADSINCIVFWTDSNETHASQKNGKFAGEYDWVIDGIPGTEPSVQIAYAKEFPGQEDYQIQDNGDPFGIKVYTDRYYRDIKDFILYYAVNKKTPTYTSGAEYYWYNELYELELKDINKNKYNGILEFGLINDEVDSVSGAWSGEVLVENICYCRKAKRFAYYNNNEYFSGFDGSEKYLNGDYTRDDIIYRKIDTQQYYIIIKECLTKCTLSADTEAVQYPTVYFCHRSEMFQKSSILSIESVSDFTYKLATDRLYSRLTIGYEKQDYDLGNNGKDEFNFKSVYTTGVILDDKELNMVSPYRADSYGFEELSNKIGEETSSTESDTQLFAVSCVKTDKEYVVLRNNRIEGVGTDSMFNADLAPIFMIEANKSYLASFAKKLTFVSSEGNSGVSIGGKSVAGDIDLSDSMFGHGNISFTTNKLVLPEDWNGCVEIPWNGGKKKGFLSTLDINVANTEAYDYELIEIE